MANTENTIEFFSPDKRAMVSFTSKKYINRVKKLAEKFPDEVEIVAINTDGSICAWVPVQWVKLQPKVKVNLTDEQKEERRERMKALRLNVKKSE